MDFPDTVFISNPAGINFSRHVRNRNDRITAVTLEGICAALMLILSAGLCCRQVSQSCH